MLAQGPLARLLPSIRRLSICGASLSSFACPVAAGLASITIAVHSVSAFAQQPQFKYERRADSPAPVELAVPAKIHECESFCGDWTFTGKEGTARWENGSTAVLTVERYDAEGITIHRNDQAGVTAGLQAVYTGKLKGNQIEGEIAWEWPPQLKGTHGIWNATIEEPAPSAGPKKTDSSPPSSRSFEAPVIGSLPDTCGDKNPILTPLKAGANGLPEGLDASMFQTLSTDDPADVRQTSGQEAWKNARKLEGDEKFKDALFWYERALVKRFSLGAADIGFLYRWGLGVPFSYAMAARWYEFGAAHCDPVSMQRLAQLRMNGWGVPKDSNSAATLIGRSFRFAHDSDSAFGLAMMYRFGAPGIVAANQGLAGFWLKSANDALRMSDHPGLNGQEPGLCAEPDVLKKIAVTMAGMLRRTYTDPKSSAVFVILKETDFPLPEADEESFRTNNVQALVRHSDDEAECQTYFNTDPRNWVFRVNRLRLPPENKRLDPKQQIDYLVIPASGSQWVRLQVIRAEMMGNGIPVPMSLQNLHEFDQPH
jgi:hypothetical protein